VSRDIPALIACIEARSRRGFRWRRGRDCVSFAGACIEAQTGADLLADLPRWRTGREARAIAKAQGGLEVAVDNRLRRIAPALAQRGDIAGLPDRLLGVRLMVVEGETLVGPGARGLERLPRSAMTQAWSIDALIAEPEA
jgi:hypothetical protein